MRRTYKDFPPGWGHLRVPVSDRRSALAGLALYAACSRRARWAQYAAWAGVTLFGPRMLPGRATPWAPLGAEAWEELTERWRAELGAFDEIAGHQRTLASRAGFSALLIRRGTPVAFVKLQPQDAAARSLASEERALRLVGQSRPRTFVVPELLSSGTVREWRYFSTSALPAGLHRPPDTLPLEAITEEIEAGLDGLPRPLDTPEHWRRMHGDFAPWNLRQNGRALYLVDWENAGWGPPFADGVLYWLAASITRSSAAVHAWSPPPEGVEAIRFWDEHAQKQWRGDARDERFNATARTLLRRLEARVCVAPAPVVERLA